ncbi:MAG: signal recognition particle-docking protein FtsY [Cyanobacteria bacterium P01_D01_bin.36]
MAAFNWFERSYEEPKEDAQGSEANADSESKEGEASAPASSEDYLNWAKAAYQNIQARQAEDDEPDTESDSDEAVLESDAEPGSSADEESQVDTDAAVAEDSPPTSVEEPTSEEPTSVEEPTSEEPTSEEPVFDPSETDDSAAAESEADTVAESDEEANPTSEPTSTQAFWAKTEQATAEREARLQRLEEEAILEPEPEPDPAPPEQKFVPLDIDLDEAFLWSAEVLASQGRRPDEISLEEITWLNKLRQGLDKTRRGLVNQLKAIVGQGPLNDEAVDEIEALLLQADVGVAATDKIISALQGKLREETLPPEQAIGYLKKLLRDMLEAPLEGGHNLTFTPEKEKLSIWLMTGVNGAGKTTTIGKLAHIATKSDFKCLIGAADTFRAAAVEQVKVWGQRSGVEVIANPGQNTDPASVVFDAISAANSRDIELLLIDTAGRLQNKKNLMDELSKVRKIIDKKAPDASVESLLVLDATLGQNGLRQAQVFAEAAQLSGVVLTKLDGTARGGVALAVVEQLGLPIRFIGAGEGIEDLRPFSSYEFIEALLSG